MSEVLEKDVISVNSPEDCVRGSDVVMCVTNSDEPVLSGDHLDAGAHVTSIVSSVALNWMTVRSSVRTASP